MAYTSAGFSYNDISSLELVSIYVKNYKSLKNIHINLNPKFSTAYHDNDVLHIEDNEGYIPKERFSNVKLLCGVNGVGKTSVLELLHNPNRTDGNIVVMKTSSNLFISNARVKIEYNNSIYECNIYDREFKFTEMSAVHDINVNFDKYFIDFYTTEKKLFDDIDENLITHFEVTSWKGEETISLMLDSIRMQLKIAHVSNYDLEKLLEKDILSYLFFTHFGDSTFEDWVEENISEIKEVLLDLNSFNTPDILIKIRKVFFDPDKNHPIHIFINELNKLIENEFSIDEYSSVRNKFISISNSFDNVMSTIYNIKKVHQWGNEIGSLFYFKSFKKVNNERRYFRSLSSGEYISIKNRYFLYEKMLQSDTSIIIADEPDVHLHPEWSRQFINNFFDAVAHIRKYLVENRNKNYINKVYNFVMTTHSPFILSDFFNEEVVFFQKKDELVSVNESTNPCFAGNIGDMLIDNFFLSKTIGDYSEKKINEIIDLMNKGDEKNVLSDADVKKIEFIISRIGDRLLKMLLKDKLSRVLKLK